MAKVRASEQDRDRRSNSPELNMTRINDSVMITSMSEDEINYCNNFEVQDISISGILGIRDAT